MRNAFLPLLIAALLWNAPASVAAQPAALLAPPSAVALTLAAIPDGYFEPVSLDSRALFAQPTPSAHRLVLPRLGSLTVVHDRTGPLDPGREVMRWEGHVAGNRALKITFVKSLTGMVSGVIDTPAGRVLLGQAGDYIVYKQSDAAPPAIAARSDDDAPQALLAQRAPDTAAKPAAVAYPVQFNAAALAQVPLNDEVKLSLPGAGDFRVVHDNDLAGDLGATTFVGYLKDFGDNFRMTVTYSAAGAQGQVLTPYGLFLIRTIGAQQWLIDVGGSQLRAVVPAVDDGLHHPELPAPPVAQAAPMLAENALADPTASRSAASRATTPAGSTRIDVLVLYTAGLVSAYGGIEQAQTQIQQLVALANQAYADSGVRIVLRLAAAVQIAAPEDSTDMNALTALTNGAAPYENVSWLRAAYGADLISLVRPFSLAQGKICGTAWVGGGNGGSLAQSGRLAFSVVGDGYAGGYYCPTYTLVHELSHNMGSAHDRATVATQHGTAGTYSYSYGYGIDGQFGTVMSYIDPHVGKFSSPNITCPDATPCGIAASDTTHAADNALSLNNARATVAAFIPEAAGQTVSLAGVVTVAGAALAGVEMNATAPGHCSPSGSNGSFSCVLPDGWSGSLTPSLAGYTFSPQSLTLSDVTDNRIGQNFTASRSTAAGALAAAAPGSGGKGGGGAMDLLVLAALALGLGRRFRGALALASLTREYRIAL